MRHLAGFFCCRLLFRWGLHCGECNEGFCQAGRFVMYLLVHSDPFGPLHRIALNEPRDCCELAGLLPPRCSLSVGSRLVEPDATPTFREEALDVALNKAAPTRWGSW